VKAFWRAYAAPLLTSEALTALLDSLRKRLSNPQNFQTLVARAIQREHQLVHALQQWLDTHEVLTVLPAPLHPSRRRREGRRHTVPSHQRVSTARYRKPLVVGTPTDQLPHAHTPQQRKEASMTISELITKRMCDRLQHGTVPWHRPWSGGELPKNLFSPQPYRGVNVWLLAAQPYASPYWLTFHQLTEIGGRIRPGEHGTPVVFWRLRDTPPDPDATDVNTQHSTRPLLRY
jgi:hypothetical protein